MFLIHFFCFLVSTNANVITNKIKARLEHTSTTEKTPIETANITFVPQVHTDTHKILIVNDKCHLINEFSLSNNFNFDCYNKYLPIEFVLENHTGTKAILRAFLNKNNEMIHHQQVSNVCQKIKR